MTKPMNSLLNAATAEQYDEQDRRLGLAQHLVQTFMPVNSLSPEHLYSLLHDEPLRYALAGQDVFSEAEHAQYAFFLLHGEVELKDGQGNTQRLGGDSAENRFALGKHQPGKYAAQALGDCAYIRLERKKIDQMLCWDQVVSNLLMSIANDRELDDDADWMMTLLRSNLFYKVPPHNIRSILNGFSEQKVEANERVICQGEYGDCLYIIKQGQADVYRAQSSDSASHWLAELQPGDCFGEDALINERVRNATVKMRDDGILMRLDKQDFYQLLKPGTEIEQLDWSDALESPLQWIDVRGIDEFELSHKAGALHLCLKLISLQLRRLDKNQGYICYCDTGLRSAAATRFLTEAGFDAKALAQGMDYLPLADQQQWFAAS